MIVFAKQSLLIFAEATIIPTRYLIGFFGIYLAINRSKTNIKRAKSRGKWALFRRFRDVQKIF